MNFLRKVINKFRNKSKEVFYTKKDFIDDLEKYDVISFDIFDTLITRKLYNPDDLFRLMDTKIDKKLGIKSFIELRKEAEKEANLELKHDVNIDEIYLFLQKINSFSDKDISKLKELEINLELELCYPKKEMVEILKLLKSQNKKVILVSDMYLTEDIILKMLKKCGINKSKCFDKLYVSNSLNKRKDTGAMWEYLEDKYDKKELVHIGDNENSDYLLPKQYGFNAIFLPNARNQVKKIDLGNVVQKYGNESLDNSLYLGYVVNCVLFNSPFVNNISDLKTFSKMFHAPMLYQYFNYINKNVKKRDVLLFLAREGFYLEKLYDEYSKIFELKPNKHCYFLASRKATQSTIINGEEDLKNSVNKNYSGRVSEFFKNIYDIKYNGKDFNIKLPEDFDKVFPIVLEYSKEIIKLSKENKKNYIKYIESLINEKSNNVIIDLGYSGTIQYNLSTMLKKDFKGIYLTNSDSVKHYSKKSKLLFCFDINDNKDYEKIYHYSLILEYFLTAPHGQLQKFEKKGKSVVPIYNNESITSSKQECINEIYDGVIEFFNDMKKLNDVKEIVLDNSLLADVYISIIEANLLDRKTKDLFVFTDMFNDSEEKNVFKIISRY